MGGLIVIIAATVFGWPWWVFVIGILLLLIEASK